MSKYKEEFNKKMKTIRNSNNIIKKIKKTANKTKYRKVINFTNKEYNEPLTDLEREKIKRITGYKLFEKEYENNDNLRESIQYYSNYGYQKINKFLRSKNTSITYKELQAIKEIDKVIDKQNLKENIQVQREFLMPIPLDEVRLSSEAVMRSRKERVMTESSLLRFLIR